MSFPYSKLGVSEINAILCLKIYKLLRDSEKEEKQQGKQNLIFTVICNIWKTLFQSNYKEH